VELKKKKDLRISFAVVAVLLSAANGLRAATMPAGLGTSRQASRRFTIPARITVLRRLCKRQSSEARKTPPSITG